MRFTLSSSTLGSRLGLLAKVINTKNSISILDCFLFEIKDNRLTVTASDNSNMMQLSMELNECDGEARFCMPNRTILSAVKEISEQPLTFDYNAEDNSVHMTYLNGSYRLMSIVADDYPVMKTIEGEANRTQIPAGELANVVQRTVFATGNDELRIVMNGVYFDFTEECLNVVASDGHKLACTKMFSCKTDNPAAFILPKKPASLLRSAIAADDENTLSMTFTDSQADFEFTDGRIVCRLIEGRYPKYQTIIPQNNPNTLTIDRKAVLGALRRVLPFASENTLLIKLRMSQGNLELSAEDIDFGRSAREDVMGDYFGVPMSIGLQGAALMDVLNNLDSENIVIKLADPSRSGVIMPAEQPEDQNVLMLIMPMMLYN